MGCPRLGQARSRYSGYRHSNRSRATRPCGHDTSDTGGIRTSWDRVHPRKRRRRRSSIRETESRRAIITAFLLRLSARGAVTLSIFAQPDRMEFICRTGAPLSTASTRSESIESRCISINATAHPFSAQAGRLGSGDRHSLLPAPAIVGDLVVRLIGRHGRIPACPLPATVQLFT
ncbi:hypothetical protein EV561_12047 [Rhizobium sp. BK376]|nr:hypothetical protein EV561_12047 [Rhizobium sp. BK376]